MTKFIILFGWTMDADVVDAPNLDAALQEARDRATATGVDAEGMDDCAAAEEYTEDRALELGLLYYDEAAVKRQGWRALAPWR